MREERSASSAFARKVIRPSRMIAGSGRPSQSVRCEDYKARIELHCRALEPLSVAAEGVFYDPAGNDESDWLPWTVRRVIESGPGSRVDDVQELPLGADIAVRTTGLPLSRRKPENKPSSPASQPLATEGHNLLSMDINPRPLESGLSPFSRSGAACLFPRLAVLGPADPERTADPFRRMTSHLARHSICAEDVAQVRVTTRQPVHAC